MCRIGQVHWKSMTRSRAGRHPPEQQLLNLGALLLCPGPPPVRLVRGPLGELRHQPGRRLVHGSQGAQQLVREEPAPQPHTRKGQHTVAAPVSYDVMTHAVRKSGCLQDNSSSVAARQSYGTGNGAPGKDKVGDQQRHNRTDVEAQRKRDPIMPSAPCLTTASTVASHHEQLA